ncbi:MAG: 30S ribosomal protein S16 [Bacteroidales bacterium]
MAVKIRLARHGKKGYPVYHIVVADSRAPRDGKFIEKLGTYNPNTNPASIELNFDSALDWLGKGAQPTETTRAILSYKGVMLKKHLLGGVKKGALTPETAEQKFQTWVSEKDAKIAAKIADLAKAKSDGNKNRLSAEQKVKEAKAEILAQKKAELAAKKASETKEETPPVEEVVAEVAPTAEALPAPAPEQAEETPVAE